MKLHGQNGDEAMITWGDHWPGCRQCRAVSLSQSSSLAGTCAQGAPLLMEELAKRQAPVAKQKATEVKSWAEKAGVFKMGRSKTVAMKYVEQEKSVQLDGTRSHDPKR